MSRKQTKIKKHRLRNGHVAVIGTGVLGRQVAILLAGIGARSMSLYDPQHVFKRHVVNQGFFGSDRGLAKVDATADIAHQYHPHMELLTYKQRIHPKHLLQWKSYSTTAVFVCINCPHDRRRVWSLVKDHVQYYCEGNWDEDCAQALCISHPQIRAVSHDQSKLVIPLNKLVPATLTACMMVSQYLRWIRGIPVIMNLDCKL